MHLPSLLSILIYPPIFKIEKLLNSIKFCKLKKLKNDIQLLNHDTDMWFIVQYNQERNQNFAK